MAKVKRSVTISDDCCGLGKTHVVECLTSECVGVVSFKNECVSLPQVFTIWVDEDDLDAVGASTYIKSVDGSREVFPATLPAQYSQDKRLAWAFPSLANDGTDFMSGQHYLNADIIPLNPFGTLGVNDDFNITNDWTYSSYFIGRNVDIVTLEAGATGYGETGLHSSHPDYRDPDNTGTTRCIPMDWSTLTADLNNQVSAGGTMLTDHASSVLSAAGGRINGFAKKASLRAMYLGGADTPEECISALISWHNGKANNPDTGVPNPTICIGEWQYLLDRTNALPMDAVVRITDENGEVERPGAGWGTDFTPFTDRNIIPFRVRNNQEAGGFTWCVVFPDQSEDTSEFTALQNMIDAGIHFINAAGNNGGVYCKRGSVGRGVTCGVVVGDPNVFPKYDVTSSGITTQIINLSTEVGFQPFLSFSPHGLEDAIDVAAGQNSQTFPVLDSYSNRGPGIDVIGLGAGTWTAGPDSSGFTYADGNNYTLFSGTSCATPTVVGAAACEIEKFFHYNNRYPNPSELKTIIVSNAQGICTSATTPDWSGVFDADDFTYNPPELDTTYMYRIDPNVASGNGGYTLAELAGTTNKRVFWNAQSFNRDMTDGRRPASGGVYPRPKIRRSS